MSKMDSVEKIGKHAIHVHANNSLNGKRCLLDEGEIDYDEILRGLKDFGFTGYVSAEHGNWAGRSPLETAQHEIACLKNLAKKLSSRNDPFVITLWSGPICLRASLTELSA